MIGPSRLKFEAGNPASYRRLAGTDLRSVSSIVLAGLDGLDDQTADAQVNSSNLFGERNFDICAWRVIILPVCQSR